MNRLPGFALLPFLALTMMLSIAGCHKDQATLAATDGQNGTQDQANDPAAVNLAPSNANTTVPATYTTAGGNPASNGYSQQPSASSDAGTSYDVGPDQDTGDPGYGAQPVSYASQPPPPLPDYDQPQAPGDGYLWTPGYWGNTSAGYYWVPGAWVQAPYQGALWTPGYWGYWHHRYGFYRGYWGPHIGFYGGVNYGFGYIGIGYQGGYWGGGHFNYNRSVNNVNVSVVHNVYNRTVVGNNRGNASVSFNGGSGGLQIRARPAELAARRETHSEPMSAQVQNEHVASANRAQFAHGNQGRPASLVVSQPLAADRNVHAPAALQGHNPAAPQQRNPAEMRSPSAQPTNEREPVRNQPVQHPNNEQQVHHDAANRNEASRPEPVQQAPRQAAPQRQEVPVRPMAAQHQASPQRQVEPQRQAAAPQRQPAPQQQHQAPPPPQRPSPAAQSKPEEHPIK
jgi:hypothetical protein